MSVIKAGVVGALASASSCDPNKSSSCRMVITSDSVYALTSSSLATVTMKYDLTLDPNMKNGINAWNKGKDVYGKTSYDYTRKDGPLGYMGPLGYAGPLGSLGALPHRFVGTKSASSNGLSYVNNWCSATSSESDIDCVYGSYGPLGESGPLSVYSYYNPMYHLQETTYWYNDYNHNLDSSGVWGIQGPLGPTGALGALGALGPLSISVQAGMTTTAEGSYSYNGKKVRTLNNVRYSNDGKIKRSYDLYEMYSKTYAMKMGSSGYETNDCSFAVDSLLSEPSSSGDVYRFSSSFTQFVHINVVPIHMMADYQLLLRCGASASSMSVVATAASYPFSKSGGLEDFIVTRLSKSEICEVVVKTQESSNGIYGNGYYLFVTGTQLKEDVAGSTGSYDDIWNVRKQSSGDLQFNVRGPHQMWTSFV